jgi:hypothetical protein
MARTRFERIVLAFVLAAGLSGVAGCASDARFQQGLEWAQWNEAEKKRLDDAGFPQYTGGR